MECLIKKYMAALKRKQNAPQKFNFPDLFGVELKNLTRQAQEKSQDQEYFSSQELTVAYAREFDRLNSLVHVEPVFVERAPPLHVEPVDAAPLRHTRISTRAVNGIDKNVALNRGLGVLAAEMAKLAPTVHTDPVECAPAVVLNINLPQSKYSTRAVAGFIRARRSLSRDRYFAETHPLQARIAARGTDDFVLRDIANIKKTSAEWIVKFA